MNNRGFSLIELLVVVAIISILAAVALPVYSQYRTRTQVGQRVNVLLDFTRTILKAYDTTGTWPTQITYAGQTYINGNNGGTAYLSGIPGVTWMYYNVFFNDPVGRLRVMGGLSGLTGIPGYVAPVGANDGTYTDVRIGVYMQNGVWNIKCGNYGLGQGIYDVPLQYLPQSCQCAAVETLVTQSSGNSGC